MQPHPVNEIYLDANATSPLHPKAKAAMMDAFEWMGNPSSVHRFGRRTRQMLEEARRTLALGLGVDAQDLIFTGSGTEANYIALQGIKYAVSGVLVGATEHDAVWSNAQDATVIPVSSHGKLDMAALEHHLKTQEPPVLVSVMLVNNETGVIQDVAAISKLVHRYGGFVHTDAVQALGKIPLSFDALGVDMASFAAHKLGGPVGIGALVVKPELPLKSVMKGGGQEQGLRPGTQGVALARGFAAAWQEAASKQQETVLKHTAWIQDMEKTLQGVCPSLWVIGGESPRLPGVSCLAMPGVSNALQVMRFDLEGIAVSAGAACSSGKVSPSRALSQMGLPKTVVESAIRISLGWHSQQRDIEQFVNIWKQIYHTLGQPTHDADESQERLSKRV